MNNCTTAALALLGSALFGTLALAQDTARQDTARQDTARQDTARQDQARQYQADAPKTVLELQQFRQSVSGHIKTGTGREGTATLVNLNPGINTWFVLDLQWKDGFAGTSLHLENAAPQSLHLSIDEKFPSGIVLVEGNSRSPCELFSSGLLDRARQSPQVYVPLCGGRIYLRNPSKGHRTNLESTVEFLRDRVWGGEQVIAVAHHLLADRYRETGDSAATPASLQPRQGGGITPPSPASVDQQSAAHAILSKELGIALERAGTGGDVQQQPMLPGAWYAAANAGMWVSLLRPDLIAAPVLRSYPNIVKALDSVEASSLSYLVAFDLGQFDLGYELGTEHPRVNWSDRVTGSMRDERLSGPDGIGNILPLSTGGLIRPDRTAQTVAAFIGGFKRSHGAFRTGDLSLRNHGSHYGFVENGVVLSKLQPGLATVFVLADGSVGMKTWTERDNELLSRVRNARQNGVPVIESAATEAGGLPVPGPLVGRWSAGNWSGSEDEKQRTMRSGLALARNGGRTFLIYAVFSDASPSAMARVFQAYHADYAMLLDMNALEHTYLAAYRRSGGELVVDHLLTGMSVLDKLPSGEHVPRFLGYSDNRDFFYLTRKALK